MTSVRFSTFPPTQPPQPFVAEVVGIFRSMNAAIARGSTRQRTNQSSSPRSLERRLRTLGFSIELDKTHAGKLRRPVFFGEKMVTWHVNMRSTAITPRGAAGSRSSGRAWMETRFTVTSSRQW